MSETETGPLPARERYAHPLEATQTHLDGRQAQIHTSMPGTIVSYNPATMTATVQPAIQAMHRQTDRTRKPLSIPPVTDVPVHFPAGGGYTLTFPIKPGDECLIVFNERNIDNWHQMGGEQAPADLRMHDVNDCIVHVGLRSQPKVLGTNGGQPAHGDNVQFRSDDGTRYVEINNSANTIRTVCGSVTSTLDGAGNVLEIVAPTEIRLTSPRVVISGVVDVLGQGAGGAVGTFTGTVHATVDVISGTVSGIGHVHTGVRAGPDTSGVPVP
jgi:hypothetical protein